MKVVSLQNPKGGVGRTTLSVLLGMRFAIEGYDVGIVAIDTLQGGLTAYLEAIGAQLVCQALGSGAMIIQPPGGGRLVGYDGIQPEDLGHLINSSRNVHSIVIIDTPSGSSDIGVIVTSQSDLVLAPCSENRIDLAMAKRVMDITRESSEVFRRQIHFRVIGNRASHGSAGDLPMLTTVIPDEPEIASLSTTGVIPESDAVDLAAGEIATLLGMGMKRRARAQPNTAAAIVPSRPAIKAARVRLGAGPDDKSVTISIRCRHSIKRQLEEQAFIHSRTISSIIAEGFELWREQHTR